MTSVKKKAAAGPPPTIEKCLQGEPASTCTADSTGTSSNSSTTISLSTLRRIASVGICDSSSCRGLTWRVLLGYLPVERNQWPLVLEEKRRHYQQLVAQVFEQSPAQRQHQQCSSKSSNIDSGEELMGPHGKQAAQHEERKRAEDEIDAALLVGSVQRIGLRDSNDKNNDSRHASNNESNTTVNTSQDETEAVVVAMDVASLPSPSPVDAKQAHNVMDSSSHGDEHAAATTTTAASSTLATTLAPHHHHEANVTRAIRDDGADGSCDDCRDPTRSTSHNDAANHHAPPFGHINRLLVVDNDNSADDETTKNDRHTFLQHEALLDEIQKDVVRTHPDLKFFLEPTDNLGCRRYAAMERILFVWAKLHDKVRYVQGMNEIVGTLYFVLANDFHPEWARHAEADTYHLFSTLMEEMRDIFVPAMDQEDTGIQGRINNMNALLELHDPEVAFHLKEVGIHASFYAIRWLTTLLSREFLLPDTIRLWDSMFASTHKDNFLRYVCVTMVMVIRNDLLKGDFSACLRLLQSYPPPSDLDLLLESSRALWIYESQITLACHKGGMSLSQALCTISPPPAVVMAFGLVGGVAIVRRSNAVATGATTTTTSAARGIARSDDTDTTIVSSSMATAGGGVGGVQGRAAFLTGAAKDFLGGLGREAARRRNDYRSGNGTNANATSKHSNNA